MAAPKMELELETEPPRPSKSPLDILAEVAAASHLHPGLFDQPDAHLVASARMMQPPSHVLPEDSGVIRCICPFEDDDGFTIQCDGCYAWQHGICVHVDENNVPERYLCHLCDPRPLDVPMATLRQQKRREGEEMQASVHSATSAVPEGAAAAADTADTTDIPGPFATEAVPRVDDRPDDLRRSGPSPLQTVAHHGRKRSLAGVDDPMPSPAAAKRKRSSKSQSFGGGETTPLARRSEPRLQSTVSPVWGTYDRGDVFVERPAWKREYTPTSVNRWLDDEAVKLAADACSCAESAERIVLGALGEDATATFKRRRRRAHDGPRPSLPRAASAAPDLGLAYSHAVGSFVGPITPAQTGALPTSFPVYVETIASASSGVLAPLPVAPFAGPLNGLQPSLSCPYPRAPSHGVVSGADINGGDFIAELCGEILSLEAMRRDRSSQYDTLGVWKPGIHALPYPWRLAIDSRRFGNECRFMRSSCHPNAVIRPLIVKNKGGDYNVHFGVYALVDINKDDEILLGWEWDDAHVVHLLPSLFGGTPISPQAELSDEMDVMKLSVSIADIVLTLLGVTACACEKRKDCAVAWLYKLAAVSQTVPKAGLSREEAFELALMSATGTAVETVKGKNGGKRTAKLPDTGPLVSLRRNWDAPAAPSKPKVARIKVEVPTGRPSDITTKDDTSKSLSVPEAERYEASAQEQAIADPAEPATLPEMDPQANTEEPLVPVLLQTSAETMVAPFIKPDEPLEPAEPAEDLPAASAETSMNVDLEVGNPETVPPPPESPAFARSPPKPKLSLAAYRQRLSVRKTEDDTVPSTTVVATEGLQAPPPPGMDADQSVPAPGRPDGDIAASLNAPTFSTDMPFVATPLDMRETVQPDHVTPAAAPVSSTSSSSYFPSVSLAIATTSYVPASSSPQLEPQRRASPFLRSPSPTPVLSLPRTDELPTPSRPAEIVSAPPRPSPTERSLPVRDVDRQPPRPEPTAVAKDARPPPQSIREERGRHGDSRRPADGHMHQRAYEASAPRAPPHSGAPTAVPPRQRPSSPGLPSRGVAPSRDQRSRPPSVPAGPRSESFRSTSHSVRGGGPPPPLPPRAAHRRDVSPPPPAGPRGGEWQRGPAPGRGYDSGYERAPFPARLPPPGPGWGHRGRGGADVQGGRGYHGSGRGGAL